MHENQGNSIIFYAFYTEDGAGDTGLTVTVTVYEIQRDGTKTEIISDAACTEIGDGLYRYLLAAGSVDAAAEYVAVFHTADTDTDQKDLPAMWVIDRSGLEKLDSGVTLAATQTGVTIPTVTNLTNLPSIPADWLTAAGVKADAVTKIQTGLALEATLTAIKGAGWTTETLVALMTAIEAINAGSGSSAEEIWEYASRTLTQSAASVAATVAGSTITAIRGDTLSAALTGLGALTNYSKLWFTVKSDEADTDATAQVQIELAGGLLYINGVAATTAANGSITINDESTGDVTILLKAPETAKLSPGSYYYDIQILRSTGILVSTLTSGMFVVAADVTRATS